MQNTISNNYRGHSILQKNTSSKINFRGKPENISVTYWNSNQTKPDTKLMLSIRAMINTIKELFLADPKTDDHKLSLRIACERTANTKPIPDIFVVTEDASGRPIAEIQGRDPEKIILEFVEKGLPSQDPLVGLRQ